MFNVKFTNCNDLNPEICNCEPGFQIKHIYKYFHLSYEAEKFFEENRMIINKTKTKCMLFNRSRNYDFPPELEFIDGTLQEVVSGIKLVGVKNNLVDIVWNSNRPNRPKLPIIPLEMKFAGKSWEDKVTDLQNQMREKRANVLILTALDDVGK